VGVWWWKVGKKSRRDKRDKSGWLIVIDRRVR
jgi:hypothetical protein